MEVTSAPSTLVANEVTAAATVIDQLTTSATKDPQVSIVALNKLHIRTSSTCMCTIMNSSHYNLKVMYVCMIVHDLTGVHVHLLCAW